MGWWQMTCLSQKAVPRRSVRSSVENLRHVFNDLWVCLSDSAVADLTPGAT